MTINDLIARGFPLDIPLVVSAHQDGVDIVECGTLVKLGRCNENAPWYEGKYRYDDFAPLDATAQDVALWLTPE